MNSFRVHLAVLFAAGQEPRTSPTLPGEASSTGDTIIFFFGGTLLVVSIVFLVWWSKAIRKKK